MTTKATNDVTNEYDDNEDNQGMTVIHRSEQLKRKKDEIFVLDQASVSYRAPSGYYGNFGQTDLKFTDQRNFSPSPPPQIFEKNNVITDDEEDGFKLGDEMLQSNIQ